MANKRTVGLFLLIVGIVVVIVSVTADVIGLGPEPGFGYKQVVGTVGGVIAAIIGIILRLRR
jgi:hypothetical protein